VEVDPRVPELVGEPDPVDHIAADVEDLANGLGGVVHCDVVQSGPDRPAAVVGLDVVALRLVALDPHAVGILLGPDETWPPAHLCAGRVEPNGRDRIAQTLDVFPGTEAAGGLDPRVDQLIGGSGGLTLAGQRSETGDQGDG
jgi:hypothetical protein